jgi:hypothetical protein
VGRGERIPVKQVSSVYTKHQAESEEEEGEAAGEAELTESQSTLVLKDTNMSVAREPS